MFRQRNWSSLSTIVSLTAAALIMAITIAGAGTVWAATSPDGLSASNELQPPDPVDKLATQVPITAGPIVDPLMTVTSEDVVSAKANSVPPPKMNRQMTPEITIEASRNPYVAGLGDLTFTLTRTGDTASALDVTVGLVQDQAWLSATSSTVMFTAGASTTTLIFPSTDFSTDVTQSGTLTATVDAESGYDTSNATVSVSVISQDGPAVTVSFEETEYSVAENAGTLEAVLVARATTSVPYVPAIGVKVITEEIEASTTDDFANFSRTLVFDPSKFVDVDNSLVGKVSIVLTIVDDEIREGDERFGLQLARAPGTPAKVVLLDPNGAHCGQSCQQLYPVTILDDDPNVTVSFEQDSYEVAEGASSTITVVLSEDPQRDVTIPIKSCEEGGATCTDYKIVNDSVEFQPGATSSTFTFEAVQDSDNDDGESVLLEFGDLPPGVTEGMHPETTVTIIDDDDPIVSVSFEKDSYDVAEGGSVSVNVTLSADPERDVTIPITLTGQGGASSTDYTPVNGSVEFQPGATSSTFTFEAIQDSDIDGGESVLLEFGDLPVGVTAGMHTTTTVSITDDDPNVTVSFEQDSYEVDEGANLTIKVVLSADPERDVTIPITAIEQGSASSTDYIVTSLEFQPGATSSTFTFSPP